MPESTTKRTTAAKKAARKPAKKAARKPAKKPAKAGSRSAARGKAASRPAAKTAASKASPAKARPRTKPAKGAAAKKAAAKRAPSKNPASQLRRAAASRSKPAVDRTTEMSKELLESVEAGQRAAIDAVRKFVDTVEDALPKVGAGASRRQEVVDSAIEMTDRLVRTQYDFIRKVVVTVGKSLGGPVGK
jgi:hypothetical protein